MLRKFSIAILCAASLVAACGDDAAPSVGSIDGQPVLKSDFEAYLKFKRIPADDPERVEKELASYLDRAAVAAAIEKRGALDSALVRAELEEFRKELLISRHLQSRLGDIVDESAIANYYNSHQDKYEVKKIHVAHILFRTNQKMSEEQIAAKKTQAMEAHSRLRAGEDFSKVAAELSEDRTSGQKGGDLGWIRHGAIDPELSERAFSVEVGEVSEPFQTKFGFHILKVLEPAQTTKKPLEAVKGDIRYELRTKARRAEMDALKEAVKLEKGQYRAE